MIQFHGTQKGNEVRQAIQNGTLKPMPGRFGKGFYLTTSEELGDYFGKQIHSPDSRGRIMTNNKPDVFSFDLSGLKIKRIIDDNAKYTFGQSDLDKLVKEGYDGVNFVNLGETVIAKPEKLKEANLTNIWNEANKTEPKMKDIIKKIEPKEKYNKEALENDMELSQRVSSSEAFQKIKENARKDYIKLKEQYEK